MQATGSDTKLLARALDVTVLEPRVACANHHLYSIFSSRPLHANQHKRVERQIPREWFAEFNECNQNL